MKADNRAYQQYENNIALLKDNLLKGISIAEAGMQTTLKELRSQENMYAAKVRGLSTQERESRELFREKEIKESIFIYLMQKQEETGLSLALATPNAIIVDEASIWEQVAPKRNAILLAALLIGLIIPIAVIYIKDLLDVKLRDKEQLLRIVKVPFLGEVPESKSEKALPVSNIRSHIAEKFRIITSNLGFVISKNKGQIIMLTSFYSGEGKSFCSRNLALTLATSGKKTILIDLDMRKSEMNKTLGINPSRGIAMYLSDPALTPENIIDKSHLFHPNLDIIPIKVFPPNPVELLASERLSALFNLLKGVYDCIVVDTAPVGLVADAYHLNKLADATIFVTRMNYTTKAALWDIKSLYASNKFNNLTLILNAVPLSQYGYGYNCGHNYYIEEGDMQNNKNRKQKTFFGKNIFRRINFYSFLYKK
jgi:capsular exopolysaccharide synthesis family protein